MLTIKPSGLMRVAALSVLGFALTASNVDAATYSDRGAAIVVFPKIVVNEGEDTLITLTNVDRLQRTAAHCFYVNANYHCSNNGAICTPGEPMDCLESGLIGSCEPGWLEIDFRVILTANQPLAWNASDGLRGSDLPCPSPGSQCFGGQSNAGSRVPPVPEVPFIGELKCVQVSTADFRPINENDLAGSATLERVGPLTIDPAKYNAVGIRSVAPNNGDGELILGGNGEREYEGCSAVLVVDHLFDGARDPIYAEDFIEPVVARSELTLVPCSQDFLTQTLTPVVAQFLVFNEFEQRFSTSRSVRCLLDSQLSLIDTSMPERSIFHASVAGTIAGQTRITGVNGGLLGSALLFFERTLINAPSFPLSASAGYNIHQAGEMRSGDRIRIP